MAPEPHKAAHPIFLERYLGGYARLEILAEGAAREPIIIREEVALDSGYPLLNPPPPDWKIDVSPALVPLNVVPQAPNPIVTKPPVAQHLPVVARAFDKRAELLVDPRFNLGVEGEVFGPLAP